MYKLVTNDSSAYVLPALPYEAVVEKRGVQKKVLCIVFDPEIDSIAKIKEIVDDELKTSVLRFYEDGNEVRVEKDYTELVTIGTDEYEIDGESVTCMIAKMAQASTIPNQLLVIEERLNNLVTANDNVTSNLVSLTENVNLEVAGIKLAQENVNTEVSNLKSAQQSVVESVSNVSTYMNENFEKVSVAQEEMANAVEGVSEALNEANNGLKENSTAIEALQKQLTGVDEDSLDLDGLKAHRILLSKANLAAYLEANPVTSTAHQGIEAQYSITAEKQNLLMAMVMMGNLNPEYQCSWNATGQPCTYDWTVEELIALASDIEAVVRPLVSKQQAMEAEINACETIEAVKAVDITFN